MLIAIAVMVLILLAVVAFLAIPVEFVFNVQHDEAGKNDVALVLLFGMIRVPLTARSGIESPEKAVNHRKRKTRRGGPRKAFALLRNADLRRRLVKLVRGLLRAIKIKTLDLHLRLGLDDPADTGRLWGILGPLNSQLAGIRTANIRIEPEFAAEVFSLQSQGRITVIPLRVLSISLFFFLSPQVIRALAFNS